MTMIRGEIEQATEKSMEHIIPPGMTYGIEQGTRYGLEIECCIDNFLFSLLFSPQFGCELACIYWIS